MATTTPLGFVVPDGNDRARDGDNQIAANAQKAQDLIAEVRARAANLESAAGFTGDPLALNDTAIAQAIAAGSGTTAALDSSVTTRVNNQVPPLVTSSVNAQVPPLVKAQVPPLVADAISKDPTVAQSAATMAQSTAGLLPAWKANASYAAGQQIISPNGDVVSAKAAFTSGSTYSDTNWNVINAPRVAPNGTDWNTVVALGAYRLDSFTNAGTMTNLPPVGGSGFAGVIWVLPVTPVRVTQIAIEYATASPGRMWTRASTVTGSFTSWEPVAAQAGVLTSGADLNTLTPGKYRAETSTVATSTLNNPGVVNPFEIEVRRISVGSGVMVQVLTEYGDTGPIVSTRQSLSGNFQGWITASVPGLRTSVAAWGDSLTAGGGVGETWTASEAWPARAATALSGTTVTNYGRSGDTTDEILIRMGVHSLYFTVSGGSIPASGPVGLTTKMRAFVPRDRTYSGSLAGIPGTLSYTFASSSWTFTRTTSGSATPVSGYVLFVSGQTVTRKSALVFWAGRNDWDFNVSGLDGTLADHILANHRKVLDFVSPGEKRVLFFGPTLNTTEKSGTPGYTRVWALIDRMKYMFPGTFYSVMDYLIDKALGDAGITKTAADVAAIANREAPPSLFISGDTTHFRKEIADVVGRMFAAPLISGKGLVN